MNDDPYNLKSDDEGEPPRWFGLLLAAVVGVFSAAGIGSLVADIIRAAP